MGQSSNLRRLAKQSSLIPAENGLKGHDSPKIHSNRMRHKDLACLPSYLIVIIVLSSLLYVSYICHYTLPAPVNKSYGSNGEAIFSERNARDIIKTLSQDIGFRVVSTVEEAQSAKYIIEKLNEYQRESRANSQAPIFEVDVQYGSGSHRFDMMGKVVMKMYTNITNIIVRLSCGPECDKNAILMNSHFDSSLPSPGASDDGVGVAIMLEIIRVMSQTPKSLKNAAIFLFNGAEESLQDASHSFITSHPYKDSIRAIINLESCGQVGPEILFQASSFEMIKAYKRVPYPHGTATANDVFRTGLILSDTDYRQFVTYGNLTGLDMALYKNSYFYHTELDTLQSITPGSIQHMGENSLAMVNYLTTETTLTNFNLSLDDVYFDFLGLFFVAYEHSTAKIICGVMLFVIFLLIGKETQNASDLVLIGAGFLSILCSLALAIVLPNIVAIILNQVLGKTMLWFTHEYFALLIFGPPSLAGVFLPQLIFRDLLPSNLLSYQKRYRLERTLFHSTLLYWGAGIFILTYNHIASSYIFLFYIISFSSGLLFNDFILNKKESIHLASYLVTQIIPSLLFGQGMFSLLDLFIPLCGRIGVAAPVDHIVASLVGIMIPFLLPICMMFGLRHGRRSVKRVLAILTGLSIASITWFGIYPGVFPYDAFHPKRIFVQQLTNLTSQTETLYIAHADAGVTPLESIIIPDLEEFLSTPAELHLPSEDTRDWDTIYPFSQFLISYKIPLPPSPYHTNRTHAFHPEYNQHLPLLFTSYSHYDIVTGTRNITILSYHPSLIWTVVSFSAHVTSWSLGDSNPFPYRSRYVVKHVGGYETNAWRLDLVYKAESEEDRLRVEFSALERETIGNVAWEKNKWLEIVDERMPDWVTLMYLSGVTAVFYL